MFITSLYVPKDDIPLLEDLQRLAHAKKISKNQMIMFIIRDWIENNKNYVDRKITDYEVSEVKNIIKQIPVYCKECFSKETDEKGFVTHDFGCSYNLVYELKDEKT